MKSKGSQLFKRMLVPLDGSELAETVLPATEKLALALGAQVMLIHVLEQRPPATIHGYRHLMNDEEAREYLDSVAARLSARGVSVDVHVHTARENDVARSLVEHTEEFAPDLLILCAHGWGGLRGLLYGGIAQIVLQRGTRPILLIQPVDDGTPAGFDLHRILVALDDTHAQEEALAAAFELAGAFESEVHLALAVPTLTTLRAEKAASAALLPSTTAAILDLAEQQETRYLEGVAQERGISGVRATAKVLRGNTVAEVMTYARRVAADLIVLTSDGRAGLQALLSGSVAARITARVQCPLLLFRTRTEDQ